VVCLVVAAVLAASVASSRIAVAQDSPPACGTVVADIRLDADCLAPLAVAADDVAVNLAGHTVMCATAGTTGIEVVDRRNVRVHHGQVRDCSVSILLQGGGGHTLSRLEITSGPGGGVMVEDSDDNVLRHLRVVGTRGFGVRVSGRGNQIQASELASIVAQGGTAILLVESATDTRVVLNHVHDNAVGIQVGGSGALVEANEAIGNQIGINVDGAGNTVRANEADDNHLAGLTVGAGATGNRVRANRAHGNALYDLADFAPGPCSLNSWRANQGEKLLDGCETGGRPVARR
jgi:hypothetical protein